MRGTVVKRLRKLHLAMCKFQGVEPHKGSFRFLKKMFKLGYVKA